MEIIRRGKGPDLPQQTQTALTRISEIEADYLARGYELGKANLDPIIGAHNNLHLARRIAEATAPHYSQTGTSLGLAEEVPGGLLGQEGPQIEIFSNANGAADVVIYSTEKKRHRQLTHQLVDKALRLPGKAPILALLFTKFGRQTPLEIIDKARSDILKQTQKDHFRFHFLGMFK